MMDLIIQDIRIDAISAALDKAKQYRTLSEPEIAESICLDILKVDSHNQETLVVYILALSDQLHHTEKQSQIKAIQSAIAKLDSKYEREYYNGILNERRARFLISQPMSRGFAYDYFEEAIISYQKAQAMCPNKNDEAILRQNSCVRTVLKEKLTPRQEREDILADRES